MNKTDLTERLAERTKVSRAKAADHLGSVVHDILRNLKKGKSARLPGLGEFRPGADGRIHFEQKMPHGKE